MEPRHNVLSLLACAAGWLLTATHLQAQPDALASRADSALTRCLADIETRAPTGAANSQRAEALWRAEVARRPSSSAAHVGLARTLVQCQMRTGGTTDMAALFEETVAELQLAIRLDPQHWSPRLTLGLVLAGAPPFLGQSADAIVQLEQATGASGMPPGLPEMADALSALQKLYDEAGRRDDAARVRARGKSLFPNDGRFREPAGSPPDGSSGVSASTPSQLSRVSVTVVAPEAQRRRGGRSLSSLDVVTAPGGTADLLQAMQSLPGVTGGSESSDLAIRGGDPEEAPFFLDGARLAYAGKFESLSGGLFGAIDPSVLRYARVSAGAFSARYGDALSGVLETASLGRPGGKSWRVGANSTGVSGSVARPYTSRSGSWGTFRATHTGALLRSQGRRDDYDSAPSSIDAMVGAVRVVANGELKAVALIEDDRAAPLLTAGGYRGAYASSGRTAAAIVAGELAAVGPLTALRFNGALSSRSADLTFGALDRARDLTRWGARAEGEWLAASVLVRSGAEVARLSELLEGRVPTTGRYEPGAPSRRLTRDVTVAQHQGAFVEAVLSLPHGFSVTPGLRLDRLPGEGVLTADPRVELVRHSDAWSFTLAGGGYHQGRFRPTMDQPGDGRRTGVPRRADHLLLGAERRGRTTVRADVYAKRYSGFVGGESRWLPRSGLVVGSDLYVNAAGNRRSGRLTYSAMRGRLRMRDESLVPTAYDVTHSVVAVGNQNFGPRWEVGTTIRASTGRPFTAVLGLTTPSPTAPFATPILGEPNADRYPTYARVDARLSRYVRSDRALLVFYAEALNVAARGNVAAYGYDATFTERSPIRTFFGRRTIVLGAELRR